MPPAGAPEINRAGLFCGLLSRGRPPQRRLLIPPKRKSAPRSGSSRRSPCHVATLPTYVKKARLTAESRGKREQAAASYTVTLPTRCAAVARVTVEGSSKGRKIISAAGQGAGSIRLAAPSFSSTGGALLSFSAIFHVRPPTPRAGPGDVGMIVCRMRMW